MLMVMLLSAQSLASVEAAPLPCRPAARAPVPQSGIVAHTKLRGAMGEVMPQAGTMIMLHGAGGHHETVEYSIIVGRNADGRWRGSAVGQRQSWVGADQPVAMPRAEWVLPVAGGRQLDAALAWTCRASQPARQDWVEAPAPGAIGEQIDLVEDGHVVATFGASGEGAGIATLIRPSD